MERVRKEGYYFFQGQFVWFANFDLAIYNCFDGIATQRSSS